MTKQIFRATSDGVLVEPKPMTARMRLHAEETQ